MRTVLRPHHCEPLVDAGSVGSGFVVIGEGLRDADLQPCADVFCICRPLKLSAPSLKQFVGFLLISVK